MRLMQSLLNRVVLTRAGASCSHLGRMLPQQPVQVSGLVGLAGPVGVGRVWS